MIKLHTFHSSKSLNAKPVQLVQGSGVEIFSEYIMEFEVETNIVYIL